MFLHEFEYELKGISGLGEKGVERLKNLQILNVKDLIEFFPVKYEDRQNIQTFPDCSKVKSFDMMTVFTVVGHKKFGDSSKKNLKLTARSINDEPFEILLFNRAFLENVFRIDKNSIFILNLLITIIVGYGVVLILTVKFLLIVLKDLKKFFRFIL